MTRLASTIASLAVLSTVAGCGSRNSYWDKPVSAVSYGLANGVALLDDVDHRVVILTAQDHQEVTTTAFPIGHNAVTTMTSPDATRLFVLSTGDWPPRTKDDEPPSLTVIDASTFAMQHARYKMSVPLPNLAIDPLGHWAIAYAGSGASASFVQNPNEFVLFDLTSPTSVPIARTILSQGGTPQRLTFTPPLQLPPGKRRLLIIETQIDVTLLELDDIKGPEVKIPLKSDVNAPPVAPAGVVVDGFDPNNLADARIALRADNNRNVFTFTLGRSSDPHYDYGASINEIDVGGVPTDIAFVRTGDGGLRVAALVPATTSAVLADPDTSITTNVALPAPYTKLSLVTNVVGSGTGTDVAMLWSGGSSAASGVAFWLLGNTVGQPYFSIESIPVQQPIQNVDDVAHYEQLKVLETQNQSSFFVLNLISRAVSPLQTSGRAALVIAPDGQRMWAFAPGGQDLAKLDFSDLNPMPVKTEPAIDNVYDVARATGPAGGRSLIAIHKVGGVGATVFDALNPTTADSHRLSGLLLEGP
jgi:hypothetical protein